MTGFACHAGNGCMKCHNAYVEAGACKAMQWQPARRLDGCKDRVTGILARLSDASCTDLPPDEEVVHRAYMHPADALLAQRRSAILLWRARCGGGRRQ